MEKATAPAHDKTLNEILNTMRQAAEQKLQSKLPLPGLARAVLRWVKWGLVAALFFASPSLSAAEPSGKARPSVFLICPQGCFIDYLRQELNYFDFARDPTYAQFTFLIVRQPVGVGGDAERFTVTRVMGTGKMSLERQLNMGVSATYVEKRSRLLRTLLLMLFDELRESEYGEDFEVSLPRRTDLQLVEVADPWNFWSVTVDAEGEFSGGRGYYNGSIGTGLTIRRITQSQKIRWSGAYWRDLSASTLEDGSEIRGNIFGWEVRGLHAQALREHWSFGVTVTGGGSEYENLSGHLHGGVLGEYNVFPYSANASHQLRLVYQVGPWANSYIEPNVEDLMSELHSYHAFSLILDLNQDFGSIQWIGQFNQFLDDPELFRVSFGINLSVRVAEGFMVGVEGEAGYVKDLINLRGRQIRNEELLLGTAEQPTDITYEGNFFATYTFGSHHTTMVNPRFGRIDLQEE